MFITIKHWHDVFSTLSTSIGSWSWQNLCPVSHHSFWLPRMPWRTTASILPWLVMLRNSACWTNSDSCATSLTGVPFGQLVLPKQRFYQHFISTFWDGGTILGCGGGLKCLFSSSVFLSLFPYCFMLHRILSLFSMSFLLVWLLCAVDLCT